MTRLQNPTRRLRPASKRLLGLCVLSTALLICPAIAHAATVAGGGLDWETPLQKFFDSIKGPVAFVIALMGIVVTGASLIWGGEINEFVRRLVMMIMVISLIVFAASLLSNLFGVGYAPWRSSIRTSARSTCASFAIRPTTLRGQRPGCGRARDDPAQAISQARKGSGGPSELRRPDR